MEANRCLHCSVPWRLFIGCLGRVRSVSPQEHSICSLHGRSSGGIECFAINLQSAFLERFNALHSNAREALFDSAHDDAFYEVSLAEDEHHYQGDHDED